MIALAADLGRSENLTIVIVLGIAIASVLAAGAVVLWRINRF